MTSWVLLGAPLVSVPASLAHSRATAVAWATDIQPILQRHCVRCHRSDGFAPTSLAMYEEARAAANQIRQEVLERRMPPWPARRGVGEFFNDPTLSPIEIDLLVSWATGGAPMGPEPLPNVVAAPQAIREPDMIARMPGKHVVSAGSARFVLESGIPKDVWVERWELLPGTPALVSQASLTVENGTSLGSWLPGEVPSALAPGHAWRIRAGSRLVLDIHYRKPSGPAGDLSAVALYFAPRPVREVRDLNLSCGSTTLSESIALLALRARTTRIGESIEVSVRRVDGGFEPLAWVPNARTDYEPTYRLRSPLRLPRGSRLEVTSPAGGCSAELLFARM
jgi:mono/diheme cytochrome c family protein